MELARAVLDTGKPVVVYLMNGRPAAIGELKQRAAAIIEGWYMGQETGTAAADILFGDVCPSGKLTCSFPQSAGHIPAYYSKKDGAGKFNYLFSDNQPLYAFGEGLSYTTFSYSKPRLKAATIPADGATEVSVDVTNTGHMAGDEIVQMYVHQEVASVTRPAMELKGFHRVHLEPGQTKTAVLPIDAAALSIYDIDMRRTTEPGKFKIMVGPSSKRVEGVTLEVVR
jgi:beta-glucosidase